MAAMSNFSNGLSPAEAERLAMLAEEAGEIVQVVGKILRHGFESRHPNGGPTNRETLARECGDFCGVLDAMCRAEDLPGQSVEDHGRRKWAKALPYTHFQAGRLALQEQKP